MPPVPRLRPRAYPAATSGPILLTGAAGFIGSAVAARLVERGERVVGVDNFSPYYSVALKRQRVDVLLGSAGQSFEMVECDLADRGAVDSLFAAHEPALVVHLAAQAGVRHSLTHPEDYTSANLVAFGNLIDAARRQDVEHFVYASSSSVYGGATKFPLSEDDPVDRPLSLYAATKRSNELVAHSYSHLWGLRASGLRFFTVYGPWGRPDMSMFLFAEAIADGQLLQLVEGEVVRDFTYIDDVVESVCRVVDLPPDGNPPNRIVNVGGGAPVTMPMVVELIARHVGRPAQVERMPLPPGDVPKTHADFRQLQALTDFRPSVPVEEGVRRFVEWYLGWRRSGSS